MLSDMQMFSSIKGAPPISADPGGFSDFGAFDFSENVDFWNVPVGLGV